MPLDHFDVKKTDPDIEPDNSEEQIMPLNHSDITLDD